MRRFATCLLAALAALVISACDGSSGGDDGGATAQDTAGGGEGDASEGGEDGGSIDNPDVVASEDGGVVEDAGGPGEDTGGGTPDVTGASCEYTSDCDPPNTVCLLGECVAACPENPCPEGWVCVAETGVCWQECFTEEDCDYDGYRCEGSRCVAGCPWHPCDMRGSECDPISGHCTPSFCQWEIQANTDRRWCGPAEPGAAADYSFTVDVFQHRPFPAVIDFRLSDRTDGQITISGAGLMQGEEATPVELPYEAQPGDRLVVAVNVAPTSYGGAFGEVEIVAEDADICTNNPVLFLSGGSPTCLSAQPAEVAAGDITMGDVVKKRVRLRNDCDRDLNIVYSGFIAAKTDWMVAEDYEGQVLTAGGGTFDFYIFFAPTMPARRDTKLLIVTDDAENRMLQIPLQGNGVL